MSLVNDMLRDLDQRRQQPGEGSASGSPIAPAPTMTEAEPKTRWLPLLLLCLAVGLALVGLWLYDNPKLWRDLLPSDAVSNPAEMAKTPVAEPDMAETPQTAPPTVLQPQPMVTSEPETGPSAGTPEPAAPDQPQPITLVQSNWLAEQDRARLAIELSQAPIQQVQLVTDRSLQLQLGPIELADGIAAAVAESPVDWLQAQLQQSDQLVLKLDSRDNTRFEVSSQPVTPDQDDYRLLVMVTRLAPEPKVAAYSTASMEKPDAEPTLPKSEVSSIDPTVVQADASSESSSFESAALSAPNKAESTSMPMAVAPLTKSQPLNPDQRDRSQVAEARALIATRQISRAIEQLQRFLAEQPGANRSRALLGTLLIGTGQLTEAERQIDQGLDLSPDDAELKKLKARLLVQAQQLESAISLLQANQPVVKADPEYHQILAAALQANGQHQRAAEAYHGLLRQRSDEPAWWVGLALSLEALGQPQQARQAYKNVLQIPDLKPALAKYVTQRLNRL